MTSLEEKVLNFLSSGNVEKTLSIAKAAGKPTKRDINPIIYGLERKGLVRRIDISPPTWQIVHKCQHVRPPAFSQPPSKVQNINSVVVSSIPFAQETIPKQIINSSVPTSSHQISKVAQVVAKNPISIINEYAQNQKVKVEFEEQQYGPDHKKTFRARAVIGKNTYSWETAASKKEAKYKASEVALKTLRGTTEITITPQVNNLPVNATITNLPKTFQDQVAYVVHRKYMELAKDLSDIVSGRLILAGFVMSINQEGQTPENTVVSIGTGNRCICGDKMSLKGETVFDSHAEIVARRGLIRFLFGELKTANKGIFMKSKNGKCQLKTNVKFHLYISTAPCGDSAIFSPCDESTDVPEQQLALNEHHPKFENSKQGILRTKVEKGEGCIPIDENDNIPTFDGIIKGERLRTMSCSDKIAKWNFLGLQGALLTKFVEPIYLSSLTLGSLYNHGHLARAVCCRVEKAMSNLQFPSGYRVNHPEIGRVHSNYESRETGKVKTKEYSCNWSFGDGFMEVLDGTTGKGEPRFGSNDVSRICKSKMFEEFKSLCLKYEAYSTVKETYAETKQMALQYHQVKNAVYDALYKGKMGIWMKKPVEINQF